MLNDVKPTVAFLLLVFLAVSVAGQVVDDGSSVAFGLIIHADGSDFDVVRDGRRSSYNVARGGVEGLPLFTGDLIQTENDTYLEIQLLPSISVIKVAENTTFGIVGIADDGAGIFEITYGRIRAQVADVASNGSFEIRGPGAASGNSGSDFGYDYVVDLGRGDIVSAIYCFEGEVSVSRAGDGPASGDDPIVLSPNQMVTVGSATPAAPAPAFEQSEVSTSIDRFWATRDFTAQPLELSDVSTRFPGLGEIVAEAMGTMPEFLQGSAATDVADTPAADSPSDATEAVEAPRVVEIDRLRPTDIVQDEEPAVAPRDGPGFLAATTGVIGWTLTGAGILADLGAIGLYFFGSYIIPGWDSAMTADILKWVAIGGGASFVLGITSLLVSLQLSR